jgi:DNA-directed RNA polymerase sigma subunit (sigma70/sigma32)
MTTSVSAEHSGGALFVADFYPQLGEYLAAGHATGYDPDAGRARFLAWLTSHAADETASAGPVRDYLAQIAVVPRLTAAQETELAVRIETGRRAEQQLTADSGPPSGAGRLDLERLAEDGRQARNQLVEANLRLVVSLAKRFTGRGVLFLDLIQAGNLGLIRAVDKYDPGQGYRFATYASWWIRQALTRAVAGQVPATHRRPAQD